MLDRLRAHRILVAVVVAYYLGFENTGWDLVANVVGATAAALWVRRPATRVS
ncbi:MAG: hypothetical protein QNJ88_10400 [Acidimicrobiia bacterium]|nr:hypothetical protein [Acidimicrobiia bacterium]